MLSNTKYKIILWVLWNNNLQFLFLPKRHGMPYKTRTSASFNGIGVEDVVLIEPPPTSRIDMHI